ncbi:MAG: T9SS type A sorting domain-containing protein, partial [Bacteroidota bacterium]
DTCADGGFIMAGKTYDTGNAFSDILIVKADADGNELWQKKIGGNKDDVANSIVSTPNGYLICGTSFSAGNGGSDIYVALIDFSGNIVWENYYGDEYNDEGTGIYLSADNSVVFCGNRTTPDYPNNFNTYIRKIRYSGATYWATSNSTIGTSNMITNSIIEGFNKRVTTIGNFDLNSPGVNDVVLFLWDSTANYTESGTYGGSLEDYGKSVIKTSDFGYAAIGTTHSFGMGMSNIYFIKTDTVTPSNVNLTVYVGQEESIREPFNNQQPYPNPMNYTTTISLNYPVTLMMDNQLVFKIFNQLGEQVADKVAIDFKQNQNQTNITLTNLALSDGIYFYHLFSNDKTIAQGKFTVIK